MKNGFTAKSRWFETFGGNFVFLRVLDEVISKDLPPNPDGLKLLAVIGMRESFSASERSEERR